MSTVPYTHVNTRRDRFASTRTAIESGVALGFVTAAAFALGSLLANRYVAHGLGRLAAEIVRDHLLRGLALGLAGALAVVVLNGLLRAVVRGSEEVRTERRRSWLVLAVGAIIALGVLFYDAYFWKRAVKATPPGIAFANQTRAAQLAIVAGLAAVLGLPGLWLSARLGRRLVRSARLASLSGLLARVARTIAVLALVSAGASVAWSSYGRRAVPARGANVVLITVDTLRADHLGLYGHDRETSPFLDALGERGIVFERAMSQSPWTLPSMASVQTSLYPSRHGAIRATRVLGREIDTLAEILRDRGYRTIAVVANYFVSRNFGFEQGFAVFDDSVVLGHGGRSAELVTETAIAHLGTSERRAFYLWVHYMDPHYDYVDHPEVDFARGGPELLDRYTIDDLRERDPRIGGAELEHVKDLYDEEIAYTDRAVERLLAALDDVGSDRPTVVVFSADHGEYFRERGRFGHPSEAYRELIHVPLLIAGDVPPELRGTRVESVVETRSIASTVLAAAGIEWRGFEGVDLLEVARGATGPPVCVAEATDAFRSDDRKRAVITDDWKLIHNFDDGSEELYDLSEDADERTNLIDVASEEHAAVLERLRAAMSELGDVPHGVGGERRLDTRELEHLRALGYAE